MSTFAQAIPVSITSALIQDTTDQMGEELAKAWWGFWLIGQAGSLPDPFYEPYFWTRELTDPLASFGAHQGHLGGCGAVSWCLLKSLLVSETNS